MKINSLYNLSGYADIESHDVVEWEETEEVCSEYVLPFRNEENKKSEGWFRNLRIVSSEEILDAYKRPYMLYHIVYEKKKEYYTIEISDTQEELVKFLEYFSNDGFALSYENGEFWLVAKEE